MAVPAPSGATAGPGDVSIRTGKGWGRAVFLGLFGLFLPGVMAGAILSNPSADTEGTWAILAVCAAVVLLFEGLALMCVQHARSGVVVDGGAKAVIVRRGRGLGMKRTVLPVSGVAAVKIADRERRVMAAKQGLGAVIELARYVFAPKLETVYEVFVIPGGGGPRILVSPFAAKDVFAVLPMAGQLAHAIGCPLQAPFNPSLVPPGLAATKLAEPAAA